MIRGNKSSLKRKAAVTGRGVAGGLGSILDFVTLPYDLPVGVLQAIFGDGKTDYTLRLGEKFAEKLYDRASNLIGGEEYSPEYLSPEERETQAYANILAGAINLPKSLVKGIIKAAPKIAKPMVKKTANLANSGTYVGRGAMGIAGKESHDYTAKNLDQEDPINRALAIAAGFLAPTAGAKAATAAGKGIRSGIVKNFGDPEILKIAKESEINPNLGTLIDSNTPGGKRLQTFINTMGQFVGGEGLKHNNKKFNEKLSAQVTGLPHDSTLNNQAAAKAILEDAGRILEEKWTEPNKLKKGVMEKVESLREAKPKDITSYQIPVEHLDVLKKIGESSPEGLFGLEMDYYGTHPERRSQFINAIQGKKQTAGNIFGEKAKIGGKEVQIQSQTPKNTDYIVPQNTFKAMKEIAREKGAKKIPTFKEFSDVLKEYGGVIPTKRFDDLRIELNESINPTTGKRFLGSSNRNKLADAYRQDMLDALGIKEANFPAGTNLVKDFENSLDKYHRLLTEYPSEYQQKFKDVKNFGKGSEQHAFIENEYRNKYPKEDLNVLNEEGMRPISELANKDLQKKWFQEFLHETGFDKATEEFSPTKFFNKFSGEQKATQEKMKKSHAETNVSKVNLEDLAKLQKANKLAGQGQNTSFTAPTSDTNKLVSRALAAIGNPSGAALSHLASPIVKSNLSKLFYHPESLEKLIEKPSYKDLILSPSDILERGVQDKGRSFRRTQGKENGDGGETEAQKAFLESW